MAFDAYNTLKKNAQANKSGPKKKTLLPNPAGTLLGGSAARPQLAPQPQALTQTPGRHQPVARPAVQLFDMGQEPGVLDAPKVSPAPAIAPPRQLDDPNWVARPKANPQPQALTGRVPLPQATPQPAQTPNPTPQPQGQQPTQPQPQPQALTGGTTQPQPEPQPEPTEQAPGSTPGPTGENPLTEAERQQQILAAIQADDRYAKPDMEKAEERRDRRISRGEEYQENRLAEEMDRRQRQQDARTQRKEDYYQDRVTKQSLGTNSRIRNEEKRLDQQQERQDDLPRQQMYEQGRLARDLQKEELKDRQLGRDAALTGQREQNQHALTIQQDQQAFLGEQAEQQRKHDARIAMLSREAANGDFDAAGELTRLTQDDLQRADSEYKSAMSELNKLNSQDSFKKDATAIKDAQARVDAAQLARSKAEATYKHYRQLGEVQYIRTGRDPRADNLRATMDRSSQYLAQGQATDLMARYPDPAIRAEFEQAIAAKGFDPEKRPEDAAAMQKYAAEIAPQLILKSIAANNPGLSPEAIRQVWEDYMSRAQSTGIPGLY